MGSDILYIFDDYFDPQNSRDFVDEEYDHYMIHHSREKWFEDVQGWRMMW